MDKLDVLHSKKPQETEVLEQARGLIFANEAARAVRLLQGNMFPDVALYVQPNVFSPEITFWYGIAQMSAGHLAEAKQTLLACVVRDTRATGPLAATQRLLGESTDWLLSLPELFLEGFERAFLEKETGTVYWQKEQYSEAVTWLERAWSSAQASEYGHGIYPAIAQLLGQCLRILGRDARAISIFDKGIQHAHVSRRAPLLYERGFCNFNLMRLTAVEEDLAELQMQPGEYSSFAKFLEGCLDYGLGRREKASVKFQDACTLGHAASDDEMIFYSNVYAAQTRIEQEIFESVYNGILSITVEPNRVEPQATHGADMFLWQAEEAATGIYQQSHLELHQALIAVRAGNKNRNKIKQLLSLAFGSFAGADMLREAAFANLVLVEHYLSTDDTEHVTKILSSIVQMVLEIGNNNALTLPLRLLPFTRAYLAALPEANEFRKILSEPNTFKTLVVFADRLEIDGSRVKTKRAKSVELVRFMADFEHGLTLEEIIEQFFPDDDRATAKSTFHILRKDIADSVLNLSISLDSSGSRYTISRTHFSIVVKHQKSDNLIKLTQFEQSTK